MSSSTWTEDVQYGIRYPDGREDWNVHLWFSDISSPIAREQFHDQHDYRQDLYGLPRERVEFLMRNRRITTTVSEATVIRDTIDEPTETNEEEVIKDGNEP